MNGLRDTPSVMVRLALYFHIQLQLIPSHRDGQPGQMLRRKERGPSDQCAIKHHTVHSKLTLRTTGLIKFFRGLSRLILKCFSQVIEVYFTRARDEQAPVVTSDGIGGSV